MPKININSTTIRVTDPCYNKATNIEGLIGIIENVLPGEWECSIHRDGGRINSINITHANSNGKVFGPSGTAAVDSGQCGFSDDETFPEEPGEYDDINSFYRSVCDATLSSEGAFYGENSFFTGTAYGDGTYEWTTLLNEEDQVVSINLDFIGDDEEEDYDDEDDWWNDEEDEE